MQSDTTFLAATAKRRLTERIIPKAYRENFPPHTHGDEFKETPENPLGEGEKSLRKKITRYDNGPFPWPFLHQGRSLTVASEKIMVRCNHNNQKKIFGRGQYTSCFYLVLSLIYSNTNTRFVALRQRRAEFMHAHRRAVRSRQSAAFKFFLLRLLLAAATCCG